MEKINSEIVMNAFKAAYHQDAIYYIISKKDVDYAIYGIKPITIDICEIFLWIFNEYRGKLFTKDTFLYLLNFPLSLKFKQIVIKTKEKSLVTALESAKRYGVEKIKEIGQETWFLKR